MVNKFGDDTNDSISISNLQVIKIIEAKSGGLVKNYTNELLDSIALGYPPCYHFYYTSGFNTQSEIIPLFIGKK